MNLSPPAVVGCAGILRGLLILPPGDVPIEKLGRWEKTARVARVDDLPEPMQRKAARLARGGIVSVLNGRRSNAFVNNGLQTMLDRAYAISGPPSAISHIAVTADSTAVTAASTALDAGATGNISIKPFSPAASRTAQTVTAGAEFTEADVTWVINKVGLLRGATDAGNLIDAIGGGGVAPYDTSLSLDLTGATAFSLTMQIDVTLVANS